MNGNSFGRLFKITTFGESHGKAIGVTIEGCPSGIELDMEHLKYHLNRRRPGQSNIVSQRKEADSPEILSGIFKGKTTGTPIHIVIQNKEARSKDYDHIKDSFRPSHADYTYSQKYSNRDYRGGGRSSARETACRVAAGAIAMQILSSRNINIRGWVHSISYLECPENIDELNLELIEKNPVRCPHSDLAKEMESRIRDTRKKGDTVGGVIRCIIENVPAGIGEPVFEKLHSQIGAAVLSINACKGFEIGSGFRGTKMNGSEHNDIFYTEGNKTLTKTNYSGGVQGGISNGMPLDFRAAFKPVATIMQDQNSIDKNGEEVVVKGKGRHDPCVVPRAVVIVESMAALVLLDYILIHEAYSEF